VLARRVAVAAWRLARRSVGRQVTPAALPPLVDRAPPNEPDTAARLGCVPSEPPAPGRTLHEPAAPWLPNEPDSDRLSAAAAAASARLANEPDTARLAPLALAPELLPNEPGRAPRGMARRGARL
jgi:hypothetical protein